MRNEALEAFETRLGYALDPFQRAACDSLSAGQSVLVAAPTGSGKTTVAEFAIALARYESDREVIYTAPIKALSNQKYAELCAVYGADQVGLLTGDVTLLPEAPIKVMTTEVLRNMIYAESSRLDQLAFVILDEVHFLGDRFRGAVWEEILLHLPQHIQVVGLSATVSNVEELGDWIHSVRGNLEVIISEQRPVPLYQHVLTTESLEPLHVRGRFNSELYRVLPAKRSRARGHAPRRAPQIRHSDVALALDETGLLPAISFIFSRRGCDSAVQQCLTSGITLTSQAERREIRAIALAAVSELSEAERRALRIRSWIAGLERGIAAHHAGMLPQLKAVVEQLFQKRLLKLVFATETLALGINMPAKAVVLEKLTKFNGEDRVPLSSGEYTQLTGRAGRRGIDTEGHAVIVRHSALDLDHLQSLASSRSYPVFSSFRPTYNMAVNLLRTREFEDVKATLERSFAQFQADRAVVEEAAELQRMRDSLAGYEAAISSARSQADADRWRVRARKLRQQVAKANRRLSNRVGTIARQFEAVTSILSELGYLHSSERNVPLEAAPENRGIGQPNNWGSALAQVYGDRSLLVVEAMRAGIWRGLDPLELATVVSALTYEPRPNDSWGGYQLNQQMQSALQQTITLWQSLDKLEESRRLPRTETLHAYNAWVMHSWASKTPLDEVLQSSGLIPGDFLRWAKQTLDLLGQIASAARASEETELISLEQTASQARRLINYGIVASGAL